MSSSCYKWNFSKSSQPPLESGFYTFTYGTGTHNLTTLNSKPIVADMSVQNAKSTYPILWYYNQEKGMLYNWGDKGSLYQAGCTDLTEPLKPGWIYAQLSVSANSIYYNPCQLYITPQILTEGGTSDLTMLPSVKIPLIAQSTSSPVLPIVGELQTGVYVKISPNMIQSSHEPIYLSATASSLITDKGTNYNINWLYNSDKSLSLKLADGSTVYLQDLPVTDDITTDGTAVTENTLIGPTPGKWTIPKLNYDAGIWPNISEMFGPTSSFLYNDTSKKYLVFGGNPQSELLQPFISLYPSPQSFRDIIQSVNITYSNIAPPSIESGAYTIQTADGKCFNNNLTYGVCSWSDSTWNYRAEDGKIFAQVGGAYLSSTLDSTCAGKNGLDVTSGDKADTFVLGTGGEIFINRCGVCYNPDVDNLTMMKSNSDCQDGTWTFSKSTSDESDNKNIYFLIIGIIILLLVVYFIMKKK